MIMVARFDSMVVRGLSMNSRCSECVHVCKRLDAQDQAFAYNVRNVTVEQALAIVRGVVASVSDWTYMEPHCLTTDGDGVLDLEFSVRNDAGAGGSPPVRVRALASEAAGHLAVAFTYDVPDGYCQNECIGAEITDVIYRILKVFTFISRLEASAPAGSRRVTRDDPALAVPAAGTLAAPERR